MKLKLVNLGVLAASMLVMTSCGSNDNDLDDNDGSDGIQLPETYSFSVNGNSTVSFSGQTTRLNMANAIYAVLDASSDPGVSKEELENMFLDGAGFTDATLNGTGKKLGNKVGGYQTAEVNATVVDYFTGILEDYAENVAPALGNVAADGIPGMSGTNRQLNAKGIELDQAFAKGLIGALCLDQVANGYLSYEKISGADNTDRDESGYYTDMEHYWDEGYGYVYGLDEGDDILLQKYLAKDNNESGYEGNNAAVMEAFIKGRAAIVASDATIRDEQAAIVSQKLSEVVINKASYYLNSAAGKADYSADYFHALSEGYGFIFSLQFTYDANGNPYFSHAEVEAMLDKLEAGNGFWDRTDTELEEMADDIAAKL